MPLPARIKNWLPAIGWAGLISGLSTDAFSIRHTAVFIVPVLQWLFPHSDASTIELLHLGVRKSVHLAEYFLLSIILTRVRGSDRGWKLRWAVWVVVIAAGCASFDEFHQWFVPSRTASLWDAVLDTAGAAAAQVFLWLRLAVGSSITAGAMIPDPQSEVELAE